MQHQDLAQGRWFTMSLAEQLGNIGSEYSRVHSALESGDRKRLEGAVTRFFELLDLTLADSRWRGVSRYELARLREQAAQEILQPENPKALQKYFDHFALAARQ